MAHCGYEATAAAATIARPWQAIKVALLGVRTQGPMAPEIALDKQRPALFTFSRHVEQELAAIHAGEKRSPSPLQAAD